MCVKACATHLMFTVVVVIHFLTLSTIAKWINERIKEALARGQLIGFVANICQAKT